MEGVGNPKTAALWRDGVFSEPKECISPSGWGQSMEEEAPFLLLWPLWASVCSSASDLLLIKRSLGTFYYGEIGQKLQHYNRWGGGSLSTAWKMPSRVCLALILYLLASQLKMYHVINEAPCLHRQPLWREKKVTYIQRILILVESDLVACRFYWCDDWSNHFHPGLDCFSRCTTQFCGQTDVLIVSSWQRVFEHAEVTWLDGLRAEALRSSPGNKTLLCCCQ